jgi:hypothetical protein
MAPGTEDDHIRRLLGCNPRELLRRRTNLHPFVRAAVEALRCEKSVEELSAALVGCSSDIGASSDRVLHVHDQKPQIGVTAELRGDA